MTAGLVSERLQAVLAKSVNTEGLALSLVQHGTDSYAVAVELVEEGLFGGVRSFIAFHLGLTQSEAVQLIAFMAGVHDVGKASPHFAELHASFVDSLEGVGLPARNLRMRGPNGRGVHHAVVGCQELSEWVNTELLTTGDRRRRRAVSLSWGNVSGGHHGIFADNERIMNYRNSGRLPQDYKEVHNELIEYFAQKTGIREIYRKISTPDGAIPSNVQMLLTGLVIAADWIASNEQLFPYQICEDRQAEAMKTLALPGGWRVDDACQDARTMLNQRFGFPSDTQARPIQSAVVKAVSGNSSARLFMVEASPGEGKTEAALMAAEHLLASTEADGLVFALPTMATANGIFPRALSWAESFPQQSLGLAIYLGHSKRLQNKQFKGLMQGQGIGIDIDGEPCGVHVHDWMTHKKSLLANIVVCTIDQILMAALNTKHVMLRHIGLASKVVIIDEVHSYDAFMQTHLKKLLQWLGAYGTPVILLSATLAENVKDELARAYNPSIPQHNQWSSEYPLVTAVADDVATTPAGGSPRQFHYGVTQLVAQDDQDLVSQVLHMIQPGGCMLIIRNTVKSAVSTARLLRQSLGADAVTLVHARFVDADRAQRDAGLLECFGKPSHVGGSGQTRPSTHIVVATQVAEQSLDIDFDILVTDVCPMDVFIQRLGRVHRHERPRPEHFKEPVAHVITPQLIDHSSPPVLLGGSKAVYRAWPLIQSAWLVPRVVQHGLGVPADVRGLVDAAHTVKVQDLPVSWQEDACTAYKGYRADVAKAEHDASVFHIPNPKTCTTQWSNNNLRGADPDTDPAVQGSVRSSPPSIEVILVRKTATDDVVIPVGSSLTVPVVEVDQLSEIHIDALIGARVRVPLPPWLGINPDRVADELIAVTHPSWKKQARLSQCPVVPLVDGAIDGENWVIHYSDDNGLEINKK